VDGQQYPNMGGLPPAPGLHVCPLAQSLVMPARHMARHCGAPKLPATQLKPSKHRLSALQGCASVPVPARSQKVNSMKSTVVL
jgi:hypothetical protein